MADTRKHAPGSRASGKGLPYAPESIPSDAVIPCPLNFGKTPQEWEQLRRGVCDRWMRVLGPFPRRCELTPCVVEEETLPTFTRRNVRYRVETLKGYIWAQAYLLIPRPRPSRGPAVLVFHSTTKDTIMEPAGLAGPASLHTAQHLAERGYVALCPGNFLWNGRSLGAPDTSEERGRYLALTDQFLFDHPGWTGMGKMIWDGMRAVDYLQTLDEVDPDRIGCFGFSLGGKEALYTAAFDARLRATVSSEGGIGLTYSNWHDPWYLGPQIREPGFAMDNHEVVALIAPCAFLLMGSLGGISEDDGTYVRGYDGERSWPYIESVLPLYDMLGARDNVGMACHTHGHSMPAVARETAYRWLDKFLK